MTIIPKSSPSGRDWLAELREVYAAGDAEGFRVLIVKAAAEAGPELKDEVCKLAGEFGGEDYQAWAAGLFLKTEIQPPSEESSLAEPPRVAEPEKPKLAKNRWARWGTPKEKARQVEVPETGFREQMLAAGAKKIVAEPEPEIVVEPEPKPKLPSERAEGVQETAAKIAADMAARTANERALIGELVQVFRNDSSVERLRYNIQKAEVAEVLGYTQMDVHRSVMKEIEDAKKKETKVELPQAQKAVALLLGDRVQLWSDPADGKAYASVLVGDHWENYRIGSGEFESWVRAEYGARHFVEINGYRVPTPISTNALHEGIATMKALAVSR